jgi:arylsulfatase A-like enzyme
MLDGTELPARQAYIACHMGYGPEEGCDASSFPDDLYPDNFVRDRAIDLLDRKPKDKPWFLQVNFPGPHHPIATTSKMAESVIDREWPLPFNAARSNPMNDCPQQDQKREHPEMTIIPPQLEGRCNYAAEIENLDMLMNTIVQHVADMGEFDNTTIALAGDHG